jgi:hypothetical protein
MADPLPYGEYFTDLRRFQERVRRPVRDLTKEAPDLALASLREVVSVAPPKYQDYLAEALACYEGGQLRAAVLMVWAATLQHLFLVAGRRKGGIAAFEAANHKRYRSSKNYKKIKKVDDLLYLKESQFVLLAEDTGMLNRTARRLLEDRLTLRNNCGHPTGYRPGRGEAVIFIESLLQNVVSGHLLNW